MGHYIPVKNEGHPKNHTTINSSFIGAIWAATAADHNRGTGFAEIGVEILGVLMGTSAARVGAARAGAARARPKRRRTTILATEEPPPEDEEARDDDDPSVAAVMHVPASGHEEHSNDQSPGE